MKQTTLELLYILQVMTACFIKSRTWFNATFPQHGKHCVYTQIKVIAVFSSIQYKFIKSWIDYCNDVPLLWLMHSVSFPFLLLYCLFNKMSTGTGLSLFTTLNADTWPHIWHWNQNRGSWQKSRHKSVLTAWCESRPTDLTQRKL